MPSDIGVLTTDTELVVLSWDGWLTRATAIGADDAKGRPLGDLIPGLQERGLLARFRETLSSGAVQVLSPALHHTIIPCGPRVTSRHFRLMQQRVTVGPLLNGQHIAGLVVTVQDVTPQLDAERDLAEALVSDDPVTRRAAADAIAAARRIESLESFAPALRNEDWRVRRSAVTGLAAAADQELLRALLETLRREHRDFSTLSSALQLFAVTDVDVTGPLAELLQDDDVDLRIQAALALGEQHNPAAVGPLLQALEDPDANVRFHAVEALGRLRADAAVDRLTAIAESRDFFLAFAALEALALIRDSRVAPRLVPLLADDVLCEAASRALSELGDERVVAPLVATINDAPDARLAVISALASIVHRLAGEGLDVSAVVQESLSERGRSHVLAALNEAPPAALPALARVLGWMGGDAAIAALGPLIHDPAARPEAIDALIRQGDAAIDVLVASLSTDDVEIRSAAIGALGRIGSRRATPALVALLEEPDTAIATCGALSHIGDPAAFEPLLALIGHPAAPIRLAAIGALNSIGHLDMPARVTGLLVDDDPLTRESAVRIAGYFGYPGALDLVIARAADPDEAVRVAALEHLPFMDDARALPALGAALARDTAKARAAAARALARLEVAEAVGLLLTALADEDHWVRYFAARSLGALHDGAALPGLVAAAESDPSEPVRIAALEAIGARGVPVPLDAVARCAGDENPDVAAAAVRALGRLGGADALTSLRAAARDGDARKRKAAIDGFVAGGTSDAVAELEWLAAGDADPSVVACAITALGDVAAGPGPRAGEAVDSLVALLVDADRCEQAIAAVGRLPVALLPRVARGLGHAHPTVRRRTVEALARYRRPEATRLLMAAFTDIDARVRETAVIAVMRLGTRVFDDTIRQLAQADPSKSVRRAAGAALAAVRNTN